LKEDLVQGSVEIEELTNIYLENGRHKNGAIVFVLYRVWVKPYRLWRCWVTWSIIDTLRDHILSLHRSRRWRTGWRKLSAGFLRCDPSASLVTKCSG